MAVPGRAEAAHILLELNPPAWLVRHSAAVAEVAAFLAERLRARGIALDQPLVEAAALLHDVAKALPAADLPHSRDHAQAGADWLTRRGYLELAGPVAGHTATVLSDDQRYPSWKAAASIEERVVAYADKRAAQDLLPLDERFAEWRTKHPELTAELELGLRRATELEQEVCGLAGIEPAEVVRLPWTSELLGTAPASRTIAKR